MNLPIKKLVFSTEKYTYLKDNVLSISSQFENGNLEVRVFPDGERYQRILSDIDGREVVIIGGTISDTDTLELFDLAFGAIKYGAASLTLVIPYFGYSTMERAVKSGEIVTAKVRATLFSSLPRTALGNKVILMDLHTEGIPHYFERDIRPIHLYCKKVIVEAAKEVGGDNFVLASTDAGRAKWVESLANELHVNAAFVFKRRVSGEVTQVTSISADVKNKDVIIYDDMIRTGGSLVNAAKAYKQAGANDISVITTHGLFINGLEKLQSSGIIKSIISTDTHPNALKLTGDFLKIKSIAPLLTELLLVD